MEPGFQAGRSLFDAPVQQQVDAVQHALNMIGVGSSSRLARSQAEIALGRLGAWAEHGLQNTLDASKDDGS